MPLAEDRQEETQLKVQLDVADVEAPQAQDDPAAVAELAEEVWQEQPEVQLKGKKPRFQPNWLPLFRGLLMLLCKQIMLLPNRMLLCFKMQLLQPRPLILPTIPRLFKTILPLWEMMVWKPACCLTILEFQLRILSMQS